MRLSRQYSLLLLLFYLLAVTGLGWWARGALDAAAASVMEDTAHLVATEVAAAVDGEVVGQLLEGTPQNRIQLHHQVFDMTRRSAVVRSLEVVDRDGEVFASGQFEAIGRRLPPPSKVFAGTREPRLLSEGQRQGLAPGTWVLALPLER